MNRRTSTRGGNCPSGPCNNSPQPLAEHEMDDDLLSGRASPNSSILTEQEMNDSLTSTVCSPCILRSPEMDDTLVPQRQMSEQEYRKWVAEQSAPRQTRPSRIPVRIKKPPPYKRTPSYKRPPSYRCGATASKIPVLQTQPCPARTSRIQNVPQRQLSQTPSSPARGASKIPIPIKTDKVQYPTRYDRRNYFREPLENPKKETAKSKIPAQQQIQPSPSNSGRQGTWIPQPIIHDRIKPPPPKSPRVRPQIQVHPPKEVEPTPVPGCQPCSTQPCPQQQPQFSPSSYITLALNQYPNAEDYDEEEDFEYEECEPCQGPTEDPYNLEWRKEQLKKMPVCEGAGPESGYIETTHPAVLAMCRDINFRYKPYELERIKKELKYCRYR